MVAIFMVELGPVFFSCHGRLRAVGMVSIWSSLSAFEFRKKKSTATHFNPFFGGMYVGLAGGVS
jgi:hypothetical protein